MGFVWIVGAGPGAADLITLRGSRVLSQADVVVHDELAGRDLLALCRPGCEFHFVGKRAGSHGTPQGQINRLLVELALRGSKVVRLKGGDPAIFGRLNEELAELRAHGIPFEIVPGVTSACAAAAAAGISLTDRHLASSVVFVTGHECTKSEFDRIDWTELARSGQTLCVYMGTRRLPIVAEALMSGGLPSSTPVKIVANASRANQKVYDGTLADAPSLSAAVTGEPALILIGAAVRALSDEAVAGLAGEALPH
ncbi:MAG TPA: uroporphyrinogen-III C-methyltransferase [Candidatus Didemnitutus sp.]|nr:uroporphyrinogen-III C-methyltransferase [Candidatus Didemnitutus sp.]